MKDNKLEVGDKLVAIQHSRYGSGKSFTHVVIDRVTKTQAITTSGRKIKLEGNINQFDKILYFEEIPFSYHNTDYQLETDETQLEETKEIERRKIDSWFSEKKFTDEEKKQIYKLLNK
jgi:hypothetical protein